MLQPTIRDMRELTRDEANRRLLNNLRTTLWLILSSFVIFAGAEIYLRQNVPGAIFALRIVQMLIIAVMLRLVRFPAAREWAISTALLSQAGICVSVAGSGIISRDPVTPIILFMVFTISAGALFPWGMSGQLASVSITAAAIAWYVYALSGSLTAYGYAPIVAVLVGFGVSLYTAYDLERYRLMLTHHNIERKRAEEALQRSEEHFRSLIENASDMIAVLDPEAVIRYTSPSIQRILGYTPPELLGKAAQDIVHPDDVSHFLKGLRYTISYPDYTGSLEFRVKDTQGSWRLLEAIGKTRRYGDNDNALIVLNARDITERKAAEQLKDDLVSTVSHELRTPLTSLRGFAELMLKRTYTPEKQREFITIIHNEALRLTQLINDFLDLQRMESGRQPYHFEAIEIGPLLRDTTLLFAPANAQHQFTLDLPDGLPAAHADRDRLRQILSNLVSNAIKFSPNGGEVTLGVQLAGDRLIVRVSDQGLGIPLEAIPKLFSKFFRVDNRATRNIGGTGLGLAIVKQIIESHHGNVWVESEAGAGSTFFFSLPIAS